MILYSLLGTSLLALPVLGAVHEQFPIAPNSWKLVQTPPNSTTISLSIALIQQNMDQLESRLAALSTPGTSEYGQWLTAEDISTQFPTVNNTKVITWLTGAGIPSSSIHATAYAVNFASTVGQVNHLLRANFAYYSNGNVEKLRTLSYSIPDELANDIELITPATYFGSSTTSRTITSFQSKRQISRIERGPSEVSVAASCQTSITPSCLKQMYGVGNYTPDVKAGSRLGFGTFLNGSASFSDLSMFEALNHIPHQSFDVVLINGGVNNQSTTDRHVVGEADLDVEELLAISHPLTITEFITGGQPPFIPDLLSPTPADNDNEPYVPYYEFLLSQSNQDLPQVISNSYGDNENTVPEFYARRTCNLIGLMGLRGISILESSGDEGVGAVCRANDGSNKLQFTPQFPGTCPYLTSVGGTQAVTPEVAWQKSSGGFSNYFGTAWYQKEAVDNYLSKFVHAETKQYYSQFTNFSGRGFPDVAAHSGSPPFQIVRGGTVAGSGGTSAATPVFAGVVALLNDARLRAGKPSLGFLNPFLYSIGFQGLNDITTGQSIGCYGVNPQTGKAVPGAGIIPWATWNATPGWDPATGLGTPNFTKLKQIVLVL